MGNSIKRGFVFGGHIKKSVTKQTTDMNTFAMQNPHHHPPHIQNDWWKYNSIFFFFFLIQKYLSHSEHKHRDTQNEESIGRLKMLGVLFLVWSTAPQNVYIWLCLKVKDFFLSDSAFDCTLSFTFFSYLESSIWQMFSISMHLKVC